MKPLDDELRNALKRREPPPGFTGRVMARVEQLAEERARAGALAARERSPWWRLGPWFGRRLSVSFGAVAAVAVVLLVAISFSLWQQRRIERERREGEVARAQLMEALQITSSRLNHVRTKVRSATEDGVSRPGPARHRSSSERPFGGPQPVALRQA